MVVVVVDVVIVLSAGGLIDVIDVEATGAGAVGEGPGSLFDVSRAGTGLGMVAVVSAGVTGLAGVIDAVLAIFRE